MAISILSTTDYTLFRKLKGNRDIGRPRVEKIKNSIQSVGYITNPIICNEKMEIIDGQGRAQALKELGLPIDYVIHKGIGIKECISMNIYQENWTLLDYIKCYSGYGNENYIFVYDMLLKYPEFKPSVILPVCIGNIEFYSDKKIKDGRLVLGRDKKEVVELLDYIRRFLPYQNYFSSFNITAKVLTWAFDCEQIDNEAMFQAVRNRYQKIKPFTSIEEALDTFHEIYNFKRKERVYFKVLYDEYAENNSAVKSLHRREKNIE